MTVTNTYNTIRVYDAYFVTPHFARKKWQVYAPNAFNARCTVEEMNPGCTVDRILIQTDSEW